MAGQSVIEAVLCFQLRDALAGGRRGVVGGLACCWCGSGGGGSSGSEVVAGAKATHQLQQTAGVFFTE